MEKILQFHYLENITIEEVEYQKYEYLWSCNIILPNCDLQISEYTIEELLQYQTDGYKLVEVTE